MSCDLLFVYGTLCRSGGSVAARTLLSPATWITKASFQGVLYLVDWYPAAVPSDNCGDRVYGEVYRLGDQSILEAIDRYEGCHASAPHPHEYRRTLAEIECTDGIARTAWIYLYNRATVSLRRIMSGEFVDAIVV